MLRRARIVGDGRLVDVAIVAGRIAAVGRALEVPPGVDVVDLDGRHVMPGLWDAHVHFTQWARHRGRIDLAGSGSAAEAVARLVAGAGSAGAASPVVGAGVQDALWPDALTAEALELALPGRRVVVISHDLHSVWVSDAAAVSLRTPGSGLLRESDAFDAQIALGELAAADLASDAAAIRAAVAAASARGVVGVRDLEMADNPAIWAQRVPGGIDGLRVTACIYPQHLGAADQREWATRSVIPGTNGLVTMGSLKVFADGSLNTRTALTHEPYGPEASVGHAAHDESGLRELLAAARDRRLEVALHAIGDRAVTRALDAFEATGVSGTIEHAQLVGAQDLPRFAQLKVAASVQPQHAIDDRDVADAIWPDRAERAFAYRSLHDAGASLLLGSDAPVAPLDPWISLAAAIHRSDDQRPSWHPEQELSRDAAIAASTRSAIVQGAVGDLVVIDEDPLSAIPATLRSMPVALTVVGGRVTHSTLG